MIKWSFSSKKIVYSETNNILGSEFQMKCCQDMFWILPKFGTEDMKHDVADWTDELKKPWVYAPLTFVGTRHFTRSRANY